MTVFTVTIASMICGKDLGITEIRIFSSLSKAETAVLDMGFKYDNNLGCHVIRNEYIHLTAMIEDREVE